MDGHEWGAAVSRGHGPAFQEVTKTSQDTANNPHLGSQETRVPDLVHCSPCKVFLLALPLQEPQRHLTLKLPTAGLIPLPQKVCHPLREQHQHSLITQPDTRQSSEVSSHPHCPTHLIHHHGPEHPPHSCSRVRPLLPLTPPSPSLSECATVVPNSLKSILCTT